MGLQQIFNGAVKKYFLHSLNFPPLDPAICLEDRIDSSVAALSSEGERLMQDLSGRALTKFALEEYKGGYLTKAELQQLLGFKTRCELDAFLKAHGVRAGSKVDAVQRDSKNFKSLQTLKRCG